MELESSVKLQIGPILEGANTTRPIYVPLPPLGTGPAQGAREPEDAFPLRGADGPSPEPSA